MREKLFLVFTIIFLSSIAVAGNHTADQSLADKIPEVEIKSSSDGYNSSSPASFTGAGDSLLWIIVVGLALLGLVIYSFDFDPFKMVIILIVLSILLLQMETGLLAS